MQIVGSENVQADLRQCIGPAGNVIRQLVPNLDVLQILKLPGDLGQGLCGHILEETK